VAVILNISWRCWETACDSHCTVKKWKEIQN